MGNLKTVRPAIRFYCDGDKRRVMNVSGIGDTMVYDWFCRMHAMGRAPIRREERFVGANGQGREIINEVLDEAFLRSSAGANGIRILD